MDSVSSTVVGGSITGLIFGISYLLYKYFNRHKVNCTSGCCKVSLEQDRSPVEPNNNK